MTPEDEAIEARLDWLERAVILLSIQPDAPDLPPRPTASGGLASRAGAAGEGVAAGDVPQEVLVFLDAGKDVHAVQAYREATGAGIKEAKAVIERLKRGR
ncbi:MAG: hypothetical protein GEU88_09715 [Solirubrobacterales bacterium]|nr:hypothetical protein [Solirubrobacterales bacterium]